MADNKNYSVEPRGDDGWAVQRDETARASSLHDKKADAIAAGKDLAKKSGGELRIKGQDGKIQNSNTYGRRDPNPPRDRKH